MRHVEKTITFFLGISANTEPLAKKFPNVQKTALKQDL